MIIDRKCKICNITFKGGPRAWHCPACRYERAKEKGRLHKQRGSARTLGSVDKCVACGDDYIVKSGLQKYCLKCKKPEYEKLDRIQGMEYYTNNKDVINPIRNERRRIDPLIHCALCGVKISHGSTVKKYCDTCKAIKKKEWQREADRKRKGRKR